MTSIKFINKQFIIYDLFYLFIFFNSIYLPVNFYRSPIPIEVSRYSTQIEHNAPAR